MEIINRTDKILTYRTRKTAEFGGPWDAWITWEWIHPNQTHDKGQGQDEVYVWVADGQISTGDGDAFARNQLIDKGGPYLNTTSILLVNGGHKIVDWGAVKRKYMSDVRQVTADPEKPNPALAQGLASASAVISACATGLAALGPVGAAPATMVQLLGSMIGLATAEEGPPPPPSLDEIEGVVEKVVKDQSDKDFALEATDSFLLSQQWLLDQDAEFRTAADTGRPQERKHMPHDLVDDFYGHLESWADPNREFYVQMHRMCRHPEIAKWIIPAFLAGLGAYLQIWRLHAVANEKADRATIQQFQREVNTCSKALHDAAEAWWLYILSRLQQDKIWGTPEGTWAYHTLNRAYVGADAVGPMGSPETDTTPVGSASFRLKQISDYLDEDLKDIDEGKPPSHFYKQAWDQAMVTPT